MESGNGNEAGDLQTKGSPEQAVSQEDQKKSPSLFNWSSLLIGGVSAVAGILGTPYGIYVGGALAILGIIGFFLGRGMLKNWQFSSSERQAGSKAGSEASVDSSRVNQNRDAVDDFLGRDRRS